MSEILFHRVSYDNGVNTIRLKSWREYSVFIDDQLLDNPNFLFRGQASEKWDLLPAFDREWKFNSKEDRADQLIAHLNEFKYASRGRRGTISPPLLTDDDWWALGQHYGLHTPLLDWTESPFAALYFAFADQIDKRVRYRAVYAIAANAVREICKCRQLDTEKELRYFKPLTDENPRIVNQRGQFSIGGNGKSIERWIKENYKVKECREHLIRTLMPDSRKDENDLVLLAKLLIPNDDVAACLKMLNRMNINHLSLFPDLTGSAKYCNLCLEIDNYS